MDGCDDMGRPEKEPPNDEEMAQAIFKSWFIDFDGHADLADDEYGEGINEDADVGTRPPPFDGGLPPVNIEVPMPPVKRPLNLIPPEAIAARMRLPKPSLCQRCQHVQIIVTNTEREFNVAIRCGAMGGGLTNFYIPPDVIKECTHFTVLAPADLEVLNRGLYDEE